MDYLAAAIVAFVLLLFISTRGSKRLDQTSGAPVARPGTTTRTDSLGVANTVLAALGFPVVHKQTRQLRRATDRRETWAEMRRYDGKFTLAPRRERRQTWRRRVWESCA
jgi:hypothetical protein